MTIPRKQNRVLEICISRHESRRAGRMERRKNSASEAWTLLPSREYYAASVAVEILATDSVLCDTMALHKYSLSTFTPLQLKP